MIDNGFLPDPWGPNGGRTAPEESWNAPSGVRVTSRIMHVPGAREGGDWCEAFAVSPDVVALSIGDVSGHGDERARIMMALRRTIREAAQRRLDAAQTIEAANDFLRAFEPGEYATALFGLLSTRERSFTFANAGHPAPLLAGPGGAAYLEYPNADLLLGVEPRVDAQIHRCEVPPSSLLVLYTDGVTEHERKPLQGAAQLREAVVFAYNFSTLPTASVIERQMFLTGAHRDDAAILSVWSAPLAIARYRFRGRPFVRAVA